MDFETGIIKKLKLIKIEVPEIYRERCLRHFKIKQNIEITVNDFYAEWGKYRNICYLHQFKGDTDPEPTQKSFKKMLTIKQMKKYSDLKKRNFWRMDIEYFRNFLEASSLFLNSESKEQRVDL